ncbi:hypothetical protein C8R44DRAFT_880019 [Mycena epipterygia]|nr:hypothetical protein C8R44DRAFT_880019 [Mycena epipterygia]
MAHSTYQRSGMNPILKLKLEAVEDDKIILANASNEDDSDGDSSEATSDDESESEFEEPQEDVKPCIAIKLEDGQFERLVRDIKLNEGSSSASMLAKDWDFTIYDNMDYREDLRAASGIGRRRRRGDRQAGPTLSFQTKGLIGQGNQAYVDGDLPRAISTLAMWRLWDRTILARDIGDLKTTHVAFLGILARFPYNLNILSDLRTVLVDLGDLQTCSTLFQDAFDYYRSPFLSGVGPAASSGLGVPGEGFALLVILVLADLHNILEEYERGIDMIRAGCRWLQGRYEQIYWDLCGDDREFDSESADVARTVDAIDIDPGYYELDVNARYRLAIARIKRGKSRRGRYFDYAPLCTEIADAYFERELFAEARCIYELLGGNDTTSSEAAEVYEASKSKVSSVDDVRIEENPVRKLESTNNEAKMKLAEVYEILNEPRKALELVYEVIDSRRRFASSSLSQIDHRWSEGFNIARAFYPPAASSEHSP